MQANSVRTRVDMESAPTVIILVGIGGLAAARSRSGSDMRTGMSFIALAPLRYPDGPLHATKARCRK